MKKINKTTSSENQNPQQGKAEITDAINFQLIQILPIKQKKSGLIGREIPGIEGYISKIIRKEKIGVTDLVRVETSEGKDFYLYPDGRPVYVKNIDGTNTEYLMLPDGKPTSYMGREIINGKKQGDVQMAFDTSDFCLIETTDCFGYKAIIYNFSLENLGDKSYIKLTSQQPNGKYQYFADQETGEILSVGGKSIRGLEQKWIGLGGRTIQQVHLNERFPSGEGKFIFTDTFEELNIEGIRGDIQSIGNMQRIGPYSLQPVKTGLGEWFVDMDKMKVFNIPKTDFEINARLVGNRQRNPSYSTIYNKKVQKLNVSCPRFKGFDGLKSLVVSSDTGVPVKIPGKDFFIDDMSEYDGNHSRLINGYEYGRVSVFDIKGSYKVYLRKGVLSVLEATLLNGEKVIINNLFDEECRTLHIDGKEIITSKINKRKDSMLIDKKTFQEVIVKIPGTDEEINLIWHHVLNMGGEEIIQVGTKSGKDIYLYKKNLTPLKSHEWRDMGKISKT